MTLTATTKPTPLAAKLEALNACKEAVVWVNSQGRKTHQTLWDTCEDGQWMTWLLQQLYEKKKKIIPQTLENHVLFVRLACAFARESLKFVPKGEDRPRLAIEAAEAWADNPSEAASAASRAASEAASRAAGAAARAAEAAAWAAADAAARAARAAADAARAASRAARAASRAAWEAVSAASAASAASTATWAASAASTATWAASKKRQAELARQFFPKAPRLKLT